VFYVIPQAEHKQNKYAKQHSSELIDFTKKIGGVNVCGPADPGESTGDKQEFYCQSAGDYNGCYGGKDCDAAAEGDGPGGESVSGGPGHEAESLSEFFCQGGQEQRQKERAGQKSYC
jgi:hypothetical protein